MYPAGREDRSMTQRPGMHDLRSLKRSQARPRMDGPKGAATAVEAGILPCAPDASFDRFPTLARTL